MDIIGIGVGLKVGVLVGEGVNVGVCVGISVAVGVDVETSVAVAVGAGRLGVGVGVGTTVDVGSGVGVTVARWGVGVRVAVGMGVPVGIGVAVNVGSCVGSTVARSSVGEGIADGAHPLVERQTNPISIKIANRAQRRSLISPPLAFIPDMIVTMVYRLWESEGDRYWSVVNLSLVDKHPIRRPLEIIQVGPLPKERLQQPFGPEIGALCRSARRSMNFALDQGKICGFTGFQLIF